MKYTDSKELMTKLTWVANRIEGYNATKRMAVDNTNGAGIVAVKALPVREEELNQLIDELALTLPTIQALVRWYSGQRKPTEGGDSNG